MWSVPRMHAVRNVAMGSRSLPRLCWMGTGGRVRVMTCLTMPRQHAPETGDGLVPIPEHCSQQLSRLAFG
jgi:hypothetical protein